MKRLTCLLRGHVFPLSSIRKTGYDDNGPYRIQGRCQRCRRVFYAHCGLDLKGQLIQSDKREKQP